MFELNTLEGKQLKSPSLGTQDQHLFTIQDQSQLIYDKKTQNSLFKKGRMLMDHKNSVSRIQNKIKDQSGSKQIDEYYPKA